MTYENDGRQTNGGQRSLDGGSAPIEPVAVLRAFLAQWPAAIFGGCLFAAIIGVASWFICEKWIPPTYTSESLIRVRNKPPRIVEVTEDVDTSKSYRETMRVLVTAPFVLEQALREDGIAQLPGLREQPDPEQWLKQNLRARYQGRDSEILQITLQGPSPNEITRIVNAVIGAYQDKVINEEKKVRVLRLNDLNEALDKKEQELSSQENRAALDMAGPISPEGLAIQEQATIESFRNAERGLTSANFALMRAKVVAETLRAELDNLSFAPVPEFLIEEFLERDTGYLTRVARSKSFEAEVDRLRSSLASPDDTRFVAKVAELEQYRSAVEQYKKEQVPAITEELRRTKVSDVERKIMEADKQVVTLTEELKTYRVEVDRLKQEVSKLGRSAVAKKYVTSELDHSTLMLARIREQEELLRTELLARSRVELAQVARVPISPSSHNTTKLVAVSCAGAFGFFVIVITWWEYHLGRVTNPLHVSSALGIAVVGSIPQLPKPSGKNRVSALLRGIMVDSIDGLRTVLLRASALTGNKVIMISSAVSQEGKTLVSTHLATSLARAGHKTLLFDLDLRRPTAHLLLDSSREAGVMNYMAGQIEFEDSIQETHLPNLDFISAGRGDSRATSQLLAQQGGKELFEMLKESYEFVIVDTSPVLPVPDSLIVGQYVDTSLLIVRTGRSHVPKIHATFQKLQMAGVPVMGAVVGGATRDSYGNSYYGYDYGYTMSADSGAV